MNFGNVGNKNVSIIVVKATEQEVALLTQEYDETLISAQLEVEDYPGINKYLKVKDTFVTVYMFNNEFVNPHGNEFYGSLFSVDGEIEVRNLQKLASMNESGFIGKYTGSLIPNLKNEQDINISVNDVVNKSFMQTGIIADLNEDLLEAELMTVNGYIDINDMNNDLSSGKTSALLSYVSRDVKGSRGTMSIPEDKFSVLSPKKEPDVLEKYYVPAKTVEGGKYGTDTMFTASSRSGFRTGDVIKGTDGYVQIIDAESLGNVKKSVTSYNAYKHEGIAYGNGKYIMIGGGQIFSDNPADLKPTDTRWLMSTDLKSFESFRPYEKIEDVEKRKYLCGTLNGGYDVRWRDIFYDNNHFYVVGYTYTVSAGNNEEIDTLVYAVLDGSGVATEVYYEKISGKLTGGGGVVMSRYGDSVVTPKSPNHRVVTLVNTNDTGTNSDVLFVELTSSGVKVNKIKHTGTGNLSSRIAYVPSIDAIMSCCNVVSGKKFSYALVKDFTEFKYYETGDYDDYVTGSNDFYDVIRVKGDKFYITSKKALLSGNVSDLEVGGCTLTKVFDHTGKFFASRDWDILSNDVLVSVDAVDDNDYKCTYVDYKVSGSVVADASLGALNGNILRAEIIGNRVIAIPADIAKCDKVESLELVRDNADIKPIVGVSSLHETYDVEYDIWKYVTNGNILREVVDDPSYGYKSGIIEASQYEAITKVISFADTVYAKVKPTAMKCYVVRESQFTNGTAKRQSEVLDNITKEWFMRGCKSINGLRYVVDAFKSFVESGYKHQFGELAEGLDRRNVFVTCIMNDIFVRDLANSVNPLFAQYPGADFDYSYLPDGGNKQYTTEFLEKMTVGADKCFFYGPGNIQGGILRGVAGRVSNLFYRKTFDFDVIANTTGYITVDEIETQIDDRDRMYLEKFRYNPIINYDGMTIFGNFTAQKKRSTQQQIHNSELLVYIKNNLLRIGKSSVFDKGIYSEYLRTQTEVDSFMETLALATAIQPGYKVKCDFENNTREVAANKIKLIDVEYTPVNALDKVVFNINIV